MMRSLANNHHAEEVARRMGAIPATLKLRANQLKVTFPTYADTLRPSDKEWVAAATQRAVEADIPLGHVLGSRKTNKAQLRRGYHQ